MYNRDFLNTIEQGFYNKHLALWLESIPAAVFTYDLYKKNIKNSFRPFNYFLTSKTSSRNYLPTKSFQEELGISEKELINVHRSFGTAFTDHNSALIEISNNKEVKVSPTKDIINKDKMFIYKLNKDKECIYYFNHYFYESLLECVFYDWKKYIAL